MSPITFVTAGLTAGAALAAIPLIIHLVMKQTPKRILFPALRLLKERQKRSKKRLRVRNWLLLLARMMLVALMALALARPRLYGTAKLGDGEVPTALGLIFDTSDSMRYLEKDKTRLREAQDRALEILKKLPQSSQVFVIDSAEAGQPTPMSPASAQKRVESLGFRSVNRPLNQAVGQAYRAVGPVDLPRHEVYVLTDLARSAWDLTQGRTVEGLDERAKVKGGISTYVLRLSPRDLRDTAIVEAEPVSALTTQDEPLAIQVKLRSTGPEAKRVVEYYVDNVKKGDKLVAIPANGEVDVPPFATTKLEPGLHQVRVQLKGAPDPLDFDDRRYLTVDVQPALQVLLVADIDNDALFVDKALSIGNPPAYRVTKRRVLPAEDLGKYACIFLLNVREPSEASWSLLNKYVRDGGGLVVALGDRCRAEAYDGPLAASLLPAEVVGEAAAAKFAPTTIADGVWTHPLLTKYREELQKNLATVPVYRHATVNPHDGRAVLSYEDKAPALLERVIAGPRSGKVLLWTTNLARKVADPKADPSLWTDFPIEWTFPHLMDQTIPYLSGVANRRLTYDAGEDVTLPLDPARPFTSFTVKDPQGKVSDRQTRPATSASLTIVAPAMLGPWTVSASGPDAGGPGRDFGFSVNYAKGEDQMATLTEPELKTLFPGKDAYQLAVDTAGLAAKVKEGRIGFEIFPWVMMIILVLVTAESMLANRFYKLGPVGTARPVAV